MTKPAHTIPVIIVEPARLRGGLWGYDEGDISRSYSADCFSLKDAIRQPFAHRSGLYVAMSVGSDTLRHPEARAYPILHESYAGTVADELAASGLRDGYITRPLRYKRQNCILGMPVIFRQRFYSAAEFIDLIRRMYAYGGLFASQAGSYENFLSERIGKTGDVSHRRALLADLAADMPQSQAAMRACIESAFAPGTGGQLSLFDT